MILSARTKALVLKILLEIISVIVHVGLLDLTAQVLVAAATAQDTENAWMLNAFVTLGGLDRIVK